MRKKSVKKLKQLAKSLGFNKSPEEIKKIHKRLIKVHKSNKGEI